MKEYTAQQKDVIFSRGQNMLVSASAGTGKTTVMVERICTMIEQGEADISEIIVVTFTNLAAAEMKKRLTDKLSEKKTDIRIAEQMERIDSANISTLHSFCSVLLRNYFYAVDIDPSFAILDNVTVNSLKRNALTDVFNDYYAEKDEVFQQVYQIFSSSRREENLRKTILEIYEFGRCLENFDLWYQQKRNNFLTFDENNAILKAIEENIFVNIKDIHNRFIQLADQCHQIGEKDFEQICNFNAQLTADFENLQQAINMVCTVKLQGLPNRNSKKPNAYGLDVDEEERLRAAFKAISSDWEHLSKQFSELCGGKSFDELKEETKKTVVITDKLVEIALRFEEKYFDAKKQRGGLDFGDLEHLALKVLQSPEAAESIRERYKYLFVDEYQDTNPIQEALMMLLCQKDSLFTVGDIKQSIYGFRGCEPSIFLQKYKNYKRNGSGKVVELNTNFRSNSEVLNFVNKVFCQLMTEDFGKVDYSSTSQFEGVKAPSRSPSVQINLVVSPEKQLKEIEDIYDITDEDLTKQSAATQQGEVIVEKIRQCVGTAYKNKKGNADVIHYGDIVILMRGLTNKAMEIFNCLVSHNIPVVANFKTESFQNKEVREVINLLRIIDNPYNDMYLAGVCLSSFGKLTETELAAVKIATADEKVPFITRLEKYVGTYKDAISQKIDDLLQLMAKLRFFARGACVDETALKALEWTNFHFYVEGLPNGNMRLRKLYNFIEQIKSKSYAQSIDKFLQYLEETEDISSEETMMAGNAVRIMTMHAAKGLEFPVVIIAGAETSFVQDRATVKKNADIGIATKYYDFDAMKVSQTLGAMACSGCNTIKDSEEEMRLLYVALTRAEHLLYVVGSANETLLNEQPRLIRNGKSHLEWIMSALKKQYGKLYNGFNRDGIKIEIIKQTEQAVLPSVENLLCTQQQDVAQVLQDINYSYPYKQATEIPSKLVSSALDRDYIYDEPRNETVLVEDNDRTFIGTAYHKVYEYVDYNSDKEGIERLIAALVESGKIEKIYADKLDVNLIYSTLQNKQLRQLMSEGKVYHELPFMLQLPYSQIETDFYTPEDVMLQGVIDMLVINNDKAVVVDFKYTSHSEFIRKNYAKQIASYKIAVENITGIKDIQCYVLSIADNKLVKM